MKPAEGKETESTEPKTVRDRVVEILSEFSDSLPPEIEDRDTFKELKIGSLGAGEYLEVRFRLEKEFGIKLPDERIAKEENLPKVTVGEVVKLISSLVDTAVIG